MKCECGRTMKVVEFIKSNGTTNRPHDRVILQCSCGSVTATRYDPRDFYTSKQRRVIERMMRESE